MSASSLWPGTVGTDLMEGLVNLMSQPDPATDLELLRRIAASDSLALGEFYDRHGQTLFNLACRILDDPKEAEDVVQEVFLTLWDKAAQFDAGLGRPLGWAVTLTRHRAIDRLRSSRRRRTRFLSESEFETMPEQACDAAVVPDGVERSEQGGLLRNALAGLPEGQRRAIELAFFEGLSQTEVAALLNEPLGTVKARIRRGMLKLRADLAPCL